MLCLYPCQYPLKTTGFQCDLCVDCFLTFSSDAAQAIGDFLLLLLLFWW